MWKLNHEIDRIEEMKLIGYRITSLILAIVSVFGMVFFAGGVAVAEDLMPGSASLSTPDFRAQCTSFWMKWPAAGQKAWIKSYPVDDPYMPIGNEKATDLATYSGALMEGGLSAFAKASNVARYEYIYVDSTIAKENIDPNAKWNSVTSPCGLADISAEAVCNGVYWDLMVSPGFNSKQGGLTIRTTIDGVEDVQSVNFARSWLVNNPDPTGSSS